MGDDAFGLGKRRRERFLANDVNAPLRGLRANLPMRRRRRNDVHECRFLDIEHLAVIMVKFLDPESFRDLRRLHRVAVAERHDLDFRDALPRFVLEVAEVARADANAFEFLVRHMVNQWAFSGGIAESFNRSVESSNGLPPRSAQPEAV